MFNFNIIEILLTIPGIIIGLAFHEFAHALAADRLGDPTPRSQGRLTLSPLPHIDPIGFLLLIFARFGWAKPVQINTRYFKKPRRDEILVSLAGPFMNLFLAVVFTGLIKLFHTMGFFEMFSSSIASNLIFMLMYTVLINIVLFLFNLIPLPPLDGFHILANIIHPRNYKLIYALQQYSTIILLLIIVTNITSYIISPPANFIFLMLRRLFSI